MWHKKALGREAAIKEIWSRDLSCEDRECMEIWSP